MRTGIWVLLLFCALSLVGIVTLVAQNPRSGQDQDAVLIPGSSIEQPDDVGKKAHTNHMILVRPKAGGGPSGLHPDQIRVAYNLPSTGGFNTIAIVDAYHYPTAEADLNAFSTTFGLPACTTSNGCFSVVYASGTQPPTDCGWAQEAALDIQWAHAMAPGAKIVLVEAASAYFSDMFNAVQVASEIVARSKKHGQVSLSWGGSEFSSQVNFEQYLIKDGVVFFAASGDTGGKVIYPGTSPNVVSAGGTTLKFDSAGNISETGWSGSGGGNSRFFQRPDHQNGISNIVGVKRGVPDFSFDADPSTGVSVYDSTPCGNYSGWMVFGGTSVSSPSLAGIVNLAGHFSASSDLELHTIYANLGSGNFRDITDGRAGRYRAGSGWDFVTGVGSNLGLAGK